MGRAIAGITDPEEADLPPWEQSKSRILSTSAAQSLRVVLGAGSARAGAFTTSSSTVGLSFSERAGETTWHVTLKTRSCLSAEGGRMLREDGLGICEQLCYTKRACHQVTRPEPLAILHLLSGEGYKGWSGGLPREWSEVEVSISTSKEFCDLCDVKYGGYLRRDIRAAMSRDELPERGEREGQRTEVVRQLETSGGMRVTLEFVYDWAQEEERWKLVDVVAMAKGPAPGV